MFTGQDERSSIPMIIRMIMTTQWYALSSVAKQVQSLVIMGIGADLTSSNTSPDMIKAMLRGLDYNTLKLKQRF